LVWADGHPEYGGLHTDFRLDKEGEEIVLSAADGTTVIDYVSFGPQVGDWSRGRYPDGMGGMSNSVAFIGMFPTPGMRNVPEACAGLAVVCALLCAARRSNR
jgi:hypothetical protein